MKKTGILLVNLGSPSAPDIKNVRKFLREFLSDPKVIDLPFPIRQILLYCFILPFRPKQSAHAYQSIWSDQGSPLIFHNQQLKQQLAEKFGAFYQFELSMRYGEPSLSTAFKKLLDADCVSIRILPLFPQFADSTTGSIQAKISKLIKKYVPKTPVHFCKSFFNHKSYIRSMRTLIKAHTAAHAPDYFLFSYHGLPVRQKNSSDYQAQCLETTHLIAQALSLSETQYSVSFQSRLGRIPWLTPYTDSVLTQLREQGINNLAVICPSFVTDCLETLEEIGIRLKQQWIGLGGKSFNLIPALNSNDYWLDGIQDILKDIGTV